MANIPAETVTLPREHYNAIRRVLKLTGGYLANQKPDVLHAAGNGLITTGEMLEHVLAARKLMPPKARKR